MDPALDPPPLPAQPTVAVPATAVAAAAAANPTPTTQPPAHSHPPYAEMITEAIAALKERNGSSKRAIAKYIETNYPNLPPTYSALLTHHLKRLKTNGQIVMVKHSYKLPRSAPVAVNGSVNAVSSDPSSAGPKRRPGRPPKPKSDAVQAAVPVFPPSMDMNAAPGVVPVAQPPQNVAVGPGNGTAAGGTPRGRGRPPKRGGLKRGPGRPPKAGGPAGGGGVGRGRGRPQIATPAAQAARGKGPGRPRGRPPKPINVVEGLAPGAPVGAPVGAPPAFAGAANAGPVPVVGGAAAPVAGKRRGRPPKVAGEANKPAKLATVQPKKPRKLSGKPLGRPKKDASATGTRPDSQLLVAYLDLKAKLENLQSRVHQTAALIKPSLNNEAAINALQELEMAAVNVNGPSNVQNQQPPPEQPQPDQIQPQS